MGQRIIPRLIIATVFLGISVLPDLNQHIKMYTALTSVIIAGYDVIYGAFKDLLKGKVMDELFLMCLASAGAFFLGDYTEGALVLLLFQTGEYLQDMAEEKSRRSVTELMDLCPETVTVLRNGKEETVHPDTVAVGERILIHPGERIALDGIVEEGSSFLDMKALTGESVPREVETGHEVLSGCVNRNGLLRVRTVRVYGDSAISRILDIVRHAEENKAGSVKFITRFAQIYTPVVTGCAVLLFVVGSVVSGQWNEWLRRALTFLVISCPCALVISIPLTYFNGIGKASRRGILIKGARALELLSGASVVAFDKTGTMTCGVFEITRVCPVRMKEQELLYFAASAEKYSMHPIAEAIRKKSSGAVSVVNVREIAGMGVTAETEGHTVAAGNEKLMQRIGIIPPENGKDGTTVHIAVDDTYEGYLVISDRIRENAAETVAKLKKLGIRKTVMLTGDVWKNAEETGRVIGADEVFAELTPEGKTKCIADLVPDGGKSDTVVFMGDGINDAPVLMTADLGVAMGGIGSDAAIEAADIVLTDDDPCKLTEAISLAKGTQHRIKMNIVFSISVKLAVMIFGATGSIPLWLAVISDVGVCLLAILNAVR